jgi:hypothetical protein
MSDNELNLGFKDFLEREPEKFKEFLKDLGLEKLQFDFKKVGLSENLFEEIIDENDFEIKYSKFIEKNLFDYDGKKYQDNDFAKELEILTRFIGKKETPKHSEIAQNYIKASLKILRPENSLEQKKVFNPQIDALLMDPFLSQIMWRELHILGLIEIGYDKERDIIEYLNYDEELLKPDNIIYLATESLNSRKFSDEIFRDFHFEVPIEISIKSCLDYDFEIVVESLFDEEHYFKDHYDEQTDLYRLSVLFIADSNEINF